MPPSRLVHVSSGPDHALARLGALQIQLWRSAPSPDAAAEAAKLAASAASKIAEAALLIVAEDGVRPPEAAARERLTAVGEHLRGALGCAFVSEARGFKGAAVRGVVTGMGLVAGRPFPLRVFPSVQDGASWLAELDARFEPSAIERALRELREHR